MMHTKEQGCTTTDATITSGDDSLSSLKLSGGFIDRAIMEDVVNWRREHFDVLTDALVELREGSIVEIFFSDSDGCHGSDWGLGIVAVVTA